MKFAFAFQKGIMRKENIHIGFPLLLSLSLTVGMIFGYKLKENMGSFAPSFGNSNHHQQVNELIELIRMKYVDSVAVDSIKDKTIELLLAELDPHSTYLPVDRAALLNEEMKGKFSGIGIQFEIIQDTLSVISILDNSPAATSNLKPGDQIMAINGQTVFGKNLTTEDLKKMVRGEKGSSVELLVLRAGQSFRLSLQRADIPSESVDAAYFIAPKTGFIRISKFSEKTYEEFMQHLEKMKNEGMEQLILDLRDNGGGLLDDAVQIADEFIEGNKSIVTTKGAHVLPQVYTARRPGLFETGKLVVLINEQSASASEVLAGALQDWNRATIIGRRSFGKGIVQEQFQLSDGSAVRLTVARYYTPVGRNIQKPYMRGNDSIYRNEISHRYKNGELIHQNQHVHSNKKFTLKDGRTVYGEEGISPDYFIPLDSQRIALSEHSDLYRGKLTRLALTFYQRELTRLKNAKQQKDISEILNNDPIINEKIKDIQTELTDHRISIQDLVLLDELKDILIWILWKKEGYYQSINEKDPMTMKALEILRQ
jgi:carboxyl-terminal processing protease